MEMCENMLLICSGENYLSHPNQDSLTRRRIQHSYNPTDLVNAHRTYCRYPHYSPIRYRSHVPAPSSSIVRLQHTPSTAAVLICDAVISGTAFVFFFCNEELLPYFRTGRTNDILKIALFLSQDRGHHCQDRGPNHSSALIVDSTTNACRR